MRVILRFGGFHQEIRIHDDKAYQPLTIPHPQGTSAITLTESGTIAQDYPLIKWMKFEYSRQLDHDLLEYEFAAEK